MAAKGATRVSLVVPARNEAATVGDVVTRVREALVDTVALLDEIVVIDSDSTDDTYDVATDAGAVVHRSAEIRPDLGIAPGQGRGDVEVALRHDRRRAGLHGRRPPRLGHPLRARAARPAADPARGGAGQGVLRTAAPRRCRRRVVGRRPGHRARRPPADRRSTIPSWPGWSSRWPASGRSAVRCSRRCACRRGYAVELAALVDTAAALRRRRDRARSTSDARPPAPGPARPGRDGDPDPRPRCASRQGRPVPEAVTLRQYRPVDGQTRRPTAPSPSTNGRRRWSL